jgi:hypothetical protein
LFFTNTINLNKIVKQKKNNNKFITFLSVEPSSVPRVESQIKGLMKLAVSPEDAQLKWNFHGFNEELLILWCRSDHEWYCFRTNKVTKGMRKYCRLNV